MINPNSEIYVKAPDRRNEAVRSSLLAWALLGGIAGTLAMDLALMAVLWLAGRDPFMCFTMVGSTIRLFFGLPAGEAMTPVLAGIATHYSVGPALALLFLPVLRRLNASRIVSLRGQLVTAVVYAEIISQPMLVLVPVYLALTPLVTVLWYAGAAVMHAIYAVVLGLVLWFGPLRLRTLRANEALEPSIR